MEKKNVFKEIILITVIAINLMLGSLLITKKIVKIDGISPTIAASSEDKTHVDYVMEFVGSEQVKEDPMTSITGQEGTWVVEHYKEYAYHYNKRGVVIYKEPTSKEENIRYWKDKDNHS